jgi:hypothetical protein
VEITDLAKMVEHESERVVQLTLQQEREIVSDPKLLLVAIHALNHWTLDEIVAQYTISKTQCVRLLTRLDRLRIIDLLPNIGLGSSSAELRLEVEFTELHNQDVGLPLEDRFGTSLFMAMRPWAPDVFKKLQRKPIQKQF